MCRRLRLREISVDVMDEVVVVKEAEEARGVRCRDSAMGAGRQGNRGHRAETREVAVRRRRGD